MYKLDRLRDRPLPCRRGLSGEGVDIFLCCQPAKAIGDFVIVLLLSPSTSSPRCIRRVRRSDAFCFRIVNVFDEEGCSVVMANCGLPPRKDDDNENAFVIEGRHAANAINTRHPHVLCVEVILNAIVIVTASDNSRAMRGD